MKYCGFKFHFLKEEYISLGNKAKNPYDIPFRGDVYTLKLKCEEYINNTHVFAALTAMRYIYYAFYPGYINIPEAVFALKKEFKGRLDGIQALLLAFRCVGTYDYSHSFSGNSYENVGLGLMLSKKIFFNRIMKANKHTELNTILYNESNKDINTIMRLYKEKDFKELKRYVFSKEK